MTIIEKIQNLTPFLPEEDIVWADKYLLEKNYEELRNLVNSAIIRVKKNPEKFNSLKDYSECLEGLERLLAEIDIYLAILYPEDFVEDPFEDIENYLIEE